jgi:2-(1,2-epoxy-1,2-dihydrophenyl)acetyl-CoA isomerase
VSDVAVERLGDHVAVARLGRPPNNFFDTALLSALADTYEELGSSDWCRSIVLASEGRNFCAGLDFAGNADQDIAALYAHAVRLFAAPLPVVAAVQGAAVGGGFGLALSADFRVATPNSRFSANFSRLAFHHGFALSVTLPLVAGAQHAADLLFTGRRIDGTMALAMGLCDELVDDAGLVPAALRRAEAIAESGPLAVRSIRATLRQGRVAAVEHALAHECAEQERLRLTADFAEGVAASAERRPPRFTGR